jgi:hypothetical protein
MAIKVAILNVDEQKLTDAAPDSSFESEMGWVSDSGIEMEDHIDLPEEISDGDPIKNAWIMREVSDHIDALKGSGTIGEVSKQDYLEIVKAVRHRYASIGQDVEGQILGILGVKDKG